jgi:ATP-dependent RNA helicase DHX36
MTPTQSFTKELTFYFLYHVFEPGEDSNAYNKGKTLVFSKTPLPDYRADLDERHGSTQKEVWFNFLLIIYEIISVVVDCYYISNNGQIKMSNQTERRVEDLLSKSKSNTNDSASTSTVLMRRSLPSTPAAYIDKEKLSSQLRDLQNSRKVLSTSIPFPSWKAFSRASTLCAFFQMTAIARSMQSFREKLPAFNMRDGFLKAVAANQVRCFEVWYLYIHSLIILFGQYWNNP